MDASVRGRYLALLSEAFADTSLRSADPPASAPSTTPSVREHGSGRMDPEDSARVLAGFHGLPLPGTPTLHFVRGSKDGHANAYAWDEETGMVYILD
ncbi:MAG TPA: hypothetical protein VHE78_13225 [Gemmatimonadaceae bacterium]|nr:hypothetical protein [Gemmatimonadaceae bacterium]